MRPRTQKHVVNMKTEASIPVVSAQKVLARITASDCRSNRSEAQATRPIGSQGRQRLQSDDLATCGHVQCSRAKDSPDDLAGLRSFIVLFLQHHPSWNVSFFQHSERTFQRQRSQWCHNTDEHLNLAFGCSMSCAVSFWRRPLVALSSSQQAPT